MADKGTRINSGDQPVPMKLSTWEVVKSTPNCIPRLCSLTFTRIIVIKPLENELSSLLIAVKMQNSKRILRSNEIAVPVNGLLDVGLDLSFSLQYPHFLKRDGNRLQVMLQRRKKYKNRTFLGFKTLAACQINMSQVLQCAVDKELPLYSDTKEQTKPVATLLLHGLSSQPVDQEMNGHRKNASSDIDRSPDVDDNSDEEEGYNDDSSNEDLSDSEPTMTEHEAHARSRQRKLSRSKARPGITQRNLKQKVKALLKRFKISEDVLTTLESEADHDQIPNPQELDDLFDELEDSDSAPELDTMSVMSTPKPRLRPFFAGRGTTPEATEIVKTPSQEVFRSQEETPVKRSESDLHTTTVTQLCQEPRKALLEQLSLVFEACEDRLPDSLFLVCGSEWQGQMFVQKVSESQLRVISTCSDADVKAAMCFLVTKIQKFCNSNARTLVPIKLGIVGGDAYINSVLRPYVEHFSNKSPEWQNYTKFLVIPFGPSSVGKYIASIDSTYGSFFLDQQWKDTFEKPESPKLDAQDIVNRISKYANGASSLHQMPIAEALIMCKGRSSEEVSSQIFIPFLSEVRIGTLDTFNSSVEYDEGVPISCGLSSSPPASTPVLERTKDMSHTPPNSPNIGSAAAAVLSPPGSFAAMGIPGIPSPVAEFMDLQVDYWVISPCKPDSMDKENKDKKDKEKDKKEPSKCSLKTAFRALYANRLSHSGGIHQASTFCLMVVTKEKKQKIMRIGKKAKELESKSQAIEGVSRMVCTSKSQNIKLRVLVDGVEWNGVKFFQLSSQWQTHVKHFPVVIFGSLDCL